MAANEHYDLIVRNATIIDGTRAPRYRGEIGVRGGKIVKISALEKANADTEIDGSGLIAAPGFIDAHTHDDRMLLSNPDMAPKASQGVTTVVAGNCGISLAHSPANGSATPAGGSGSHTRMTHTGTGGRWWLSQPAPNCNGLKATCNCTSRAGCPARAVNVRD